MGNISGKKLLILGGNAISSEIVKAAKSMGVYTIVTDWNTPQKSPAKLYADEYWNDSLTDYDILLSKIKEHHVQGVITGFTDSYLLPYQHLCEKAGFPSYATKEVFEKTLDKSYFKQMCRDNGVPVVPEYDLETFNPESISPSNKILIKPVDNSGSRGIITCESPAEFPKCLNYSLSFSSKKKVVIEKYIDMDSFSVSYTIQDGIISMSTINDRIVHKVPEAGAVTNGGIYPSKYIHSYMKSIDGKVRQMYRNLGVRNGVLFIQGFTNGEEYYFYEMGYRLSGGCHFLFTENQNNSSSVKQLIHFALTGKMADYSIAERDNPAFDKLCFQWNILGKEDIVSSIEGFDSIASLPGIISCSLDKKIGDKIGKDGTTAQKIAKFHMVVNDYNEMIHVLHDIYAKFKVYNAKGENLVLNTTQETISHFYSYD